MSRMIFRLASVAVAAMLIAACASEPMTPPDTSAQDEMAIGQLRSAWEAAYTSGDAAALAGLYTQDAVAMNNEEPSLNGRAAIQAYYEAMFAEVSIDGGLTSEVMDVSGDLGFDSGTFSGTITPKAGGDPMQRMVRYVVIVRRDTDGSWRLARAISNVSEPAETMMPGGGL